MEKYSQLSLFSETKPDLPIDWFALFWKYVKSGSYQKFIVDLQKKFGESEINGINLMIRNVYIELAKGKFPELKIIKIKDDGSTIEFADEALIQALEPSFTRLMVGNHGIYVEFEDPGYNCEFVQRRLQYVEYERKSAKLYHQFETVNYADYKVGKWYIDLYNEFGLETPEYLKK